MTLLRRATRSFENAAVPLSNAAIMEWLGGGRTNAGTMVNESTAMGLTAYLAGIRLIAGAVGSLDMRGRHPETKATRRFQVIDEPHPEITGVELRETMIAHIVGWGGCFAYKVRNGAGQVVELWPLHPSRVKVDVVKPSDEHPGGKIFRVWNLDGTMRVCTRYEIFHVPSLSFDGVQGVSTLQANRQALGTAIAADQLAAKFFGSGTHLSGILSVKEELTEPQAKKLKALWRMRNGGVDNGNDIAVMDNGAEFKPLSIPPGDQQLLESRKWSVDEIARMFLIPPHMLGMTEKSTSYGQGIEQQALGFVRFTLRPIIARFEARYTREILSGVWRAECDLTDLQRGDSAASAAFWASAIQNGYGRRTEAREYFNLPPAEGDEAVDLAEFLQPSNLQVLGVAMGPGTPNGGGDVANNPAA